MPTIEELSTQVSDLQRICADLQKRNAILERRFQEEIIGVGGSPGAIMRRVDRISSAIQERVEAAEISFRDIREKMAEISIELKGDGTESKPGILNDVFLLKQVYVRSTAQFNFGRIIFGSVGAIAVGMVWTYLTGPDGFAGVKVAIDRIEQSQKALELQVRENVAEIRWLKNQK